MAALMKKRAPSSPTQEMQRIIQQIYDDMNDVIKAFKKVTENIGELR